MDGIPIELQTVISVGYESLDPQVRNAVALRLMLNGRGFAGHPLAAEIPHLLEPDGTMHEATATCFLAAHNRWLRESGLVK